MIQHSESITLRNPNQHQSKTWCGFPINLYVPKSTLHKDGKQEGGEFIIKVFVNDVDQDVMEGLDGIQHVMCGHKDPNVKQDERRAFGFPFEKAHGFNINKVKDELKSLAYQKIQISHRPNVIQEGSAAFDDMGDFNVEGGDNITE